jgi:predicted transposase YdaD
MAVDSMRKAYARYEVREMIEAREKVERDEVSRLHNARQEGRQEGPEEGAAVGMSSSGLSREQIVAALPVTRDQVDAWLS